VALIQQASAIASELAKIIKTKKLSSRIQGREFVHVEGWSTMGAMLGVLPREVPDGTIRHEDGSYEATVELIRINDGAIIGRASALCGVDEKDRKGKLTWGNRPEYARRSMAITRATGKAYRLGFSWIMALAGYEPTPAEEIVDGQYEDPKKTNRPAAGKKTTSTQTTQNGNGKHKGPSFKAKTVQAVVAAGHAEDIPTATRRLGKSQVLQANDDAQAVVLWAGMYATHRDAKLSPDDAAARADAEWSKAVAGAE